MFFLWYLIINCPFSLLEENNLRLPHGFEKVGNQTEKHLKAFPPNEIIISYYNAKRSQDISWWQLQLLQFCVDLNIVTTIKKLYFFNYICRCTGLWALYRTYENNKKDNNTLRDFIAVTLNLQEVQKRTILYLWRHAGSLIYI